MKLTARSLLLKIFLWFWVTVIVTGIALVLTFILEPRGVPKQWHSSLTESARYSGTIAVQTLERNGPASASTYLSQLERETYLKACLFDLSGNVIAGNNCASFHSMAVNVTASKNSDFNVKFGLARVALVLKGSSGQNYIFATELPAGPRAALGINRLAFVLQWGVALLVSGFICYLLTRYLTAPILRLREAAQQIASGDLSARASATIATRRDELGDLVRDFDGMADRIEALVARQRQLISDVSHELRSPLARLNVALDLARERKGDDPAFDQAEQDMALLDEMIGRLLTIAKLDTAAQQLPMTEVDVTELVSQIVHDANFELQSTEERVLLSAGGQLVVTGNPELLHSAIENVVRNAIHYTAPGTQVEVRIAEDQEADRRLVRVEIRDHGRGVSESELANIFRPFYRVADARDRQSGGAGLGLAIADRVIRTHGGTIEARNVSPEGLLVEILLPGQRERTPDLHS
ncbi:MAG TPA: ATP-binding protein [Terracidiphilus sp.]|jgi:two-component system sensor histidine kinase CpxA